MDSESDVVREAGQVREAMGDDVYLVLVFWFLFVEIMLASVREKKGQVK
jgi:hypothetical protein